MLRTELEWGFIPVIPHEQLGHNVRPQGTCDMGEERKEDVPFQLIFKGKLLPASPNYPAGSVK